jgi:ubiquinone/menaquinone biosynthesis C-methylase UbiE
MPVSGDVRNEDLQGEKDPGYSPRLLNVYDDLVFRFNFPVLWRCPKSHLLNLYNEQVSTRHLDIGVGTGCLLDQCRFPAPEPELTLMDFSATALSFTSQRLERYRPETHRTSVLEPWGLPAHSFDSVAMMNLLHCVPGTIRTKAFAFEEANAVLSPGGTLFGATVLNVGVDHTLGSRIGMKALNRRGIFANLDDSLDDLEAGLARVFARHEVRVQGTVGLFVAHSATTD